MIEIKRFNHPHLRSKGLPDRQGSGIHYYVLAQVGRNKILLGPHRTREMAERVGLTRANGNFDVIPLETSDLSAATQILREQGIMDEGLSPDSFRRFRHH